MGYLNKLNPIKWRVKKLVIVLFTMLILYISFKINVYTVSSSVEVPNTRADVIWDFVADFNNMKYLNPTIKEFEILKESGNYGKWEYDVKYTELLSHWPYTENINVGKIVVKHDQNIKIISSVHKTCFNNDLFCLTSFGEFKFSDTNIGSTFVVESVSFECPKLLALFCIREAQYQRDMIMNNLLKKFT